MNLIDIFIVVVMLFCFLIGLTRGFAVSFLSLIASFVSWLGSWIFYPVLSKSITKNFPTLIDTIINYTSSSKLINPLESRTLPVTNVNAEMVQSLVNHSGFPEIFSKILKKNLLNQSLDDFITVGEYFDHTIANIIVNISSFIILFIIIKIVFSIIISIVNNITNLPGLRQFDSLIGGFFAIAYSLFLLFLVFALVPVLTTVAQIEFIDTYIESSKYASFFLEHNIFTNVIRGIL